MKITIKHVSVEAMILMILIYLEILFQNKIFHRLRFDFIYSVLFSISLSSFMVFIVQFFSLKIRKLLIFFCLLFIVLLYIVQSVYYDTFQAFTHLYSIIQGTGQLMFFKQEIISALLKNIRIILLYLIPLVLITLIPLNRLHFSKRRHNFICSVVSYCIALLCLFIPHEGLQSTFNLYLEHQPSTLVIQRFGLICETRLSIQEKFFSFETKNTSHPQTGIENKGELNKMDFDFEKLKKETKDETIQQLHAYFETIQPTAKNNYTGLFEGYNLIFITAESLSDYAISKENTPTLYKMMSQGVYFKNFYNPLYGVSTSDGEYMNVVGLYPKEGVWSFARSSENALPLTMGWQFQRQNIPTYSYHNHTYTYYDRHLSHPNIWNHYQGLGNGLDVEEIWPESDVEMIQKTSESYMKNDRFHTYFMSVSGHMNYDWNGNSMSVKHYDEVKNLPYDELSKGYLAAQIEFDQAMKQLLSDLKKYDQEKTLIVIAPDHYPYGLEKKHIEELSKRKIKDDFDLVKSAWIIYSPMMEESIEVDKICSSIDILPTISNLLGFEYDSRLLMGVDVFSETEPIVVLPDGSFMNQKMKYDARSGNVAVFKNEVSEEDIKKYYEKARMQLEISSLVLDKDYYRSLPF